MKSPAFWWRHPGLAAHLLRPLGRLYGATTARRMRRPGVILPVPVLCVGNLVAGGAGKTPAAMALATLLLASGQRPAFLSRGYGRVGSRLDRMRVIRVDPVRHAAGTAGDEPLLLAAVAPTYVSSDRVAAGRRAIAEGATVLVLDDGLQNPGLVKTCAIAIVDGKVGNGNGFCVPAGPLRAPLQAQWPLVSALCVIGDGAAGAKLADEAGRVGCPVVHAALEPDAAALAMLRDRPLAAFAGIGRPDKFFGTLAAHHLDVRMRRAFPDHHRFSTRDLRRLAEEAAEHGAQLVTTCKDRVRLPPDFPVLTLPVSLHFGDGGAVRHLLDALLATSQGP